MGDNMDGVFGFGYDGEDRTDYYRSLNTRLICPDCGREVMRSGPSQWSCPCGRSLGHGHDRYPKEVAR